MSCLPELVLALVLGQPGGAATMTLDPVLPEALREVVAQAAEAELDPKRGTANAHEILKAARTQHAASGELVLALDLRIAAAGVRAHFLTAPQFPAETRREQALSTFARLDLAEPGLKTWLEQAIAANAEAGKRLATPKQRRLRVAILTRGSALERKQVEQALGAPLAALGFSLEVVPAKDAELILKVAAEGAKSDDPSRPAVRVTFAAEQVKEGKIVWEHSVFRATAANTPQAAQKSALDWVARVGGRDVFFRWLSERGFASLAGGAPSPLGPPGHDHHGHDHGHAHGPPGKAPAQAPSPKRPDGHRH